MYGVVWEAGRRAASFPGDRGIKGKSDGERAEEGSLVATQGRVMFGPGLLLGPVSGSMALRQLWSVLMSKAPDTTEG